MVRRILRNLASLLIPILGLATLPLAQSNSAGEIQIKDCSLAPPELLQADGFERLSVRLTLPPNTLQRSGIERSAFGRPGRWRLVLSTASGEKESPAIGARFVYYRNDPKAGINLIYLVFDVSPPFQGRPAQLRLNVPIAGGGYKRVGFLDLHNVVSGQEQPLLVPVPPWHYVGTAYVNLAPAYPQITGGKRELLLHAPVALVIPNVTAEPTGRPVAFELYSTVSAQSMDQSAGTVAAWEQLSTRVGPSQYSDTILSLRYDFNQAFTNRQTTAAYIFRFPLRWMDIDRQGLRNITPGTASVTPASIGYRDRVDTALSSFQVSTWTIDSSLLISSPAYHFIQRSNPDFRWAPSIFASTQGWWFPDAGAVAGQSPHHFEWRADLHFQLPIRRKVLRFAHTTIDFGLGYGAEPSQGYPVVPVISITLVSFGLDPSVAR